MGDLGELTAALLPEHLSFPTEAAADGRRRQLVHGIERHLFAPQLARPEVVAHLVCESAPKLRKCLKVDCVHLTRVLRSSPDGVRRRREQGRRVTCTRAPLRAFLVRVGVGGIQLVELRLPTAKDVGGQSLLQGLPVLDHEEDVVGLGDVGTREHCFAGGYGGNEGHGRRGRSESPDRRAEHEHQRACRYQRCFPGGDNWQAQRRKHERRRQQPPHNQPRRQL
jgi:hypothetical protein